MTNHFSKLVNRGNATNLGFVVLLLVALGCSCPKLGDLANRGGSSSPRPSATSTPSTSSSPSTTTSSKGEYELTMDKYNKLSIGMPRTEVERILGGKGTEISSSKGGNMTFSVNKWEGQNYKSIILSFKNDKIMSKSQVGLK